jgi:hypothetical protein
MYMHLSPGSRAAIAAHDEQRRGDPSSATMLALRWSQPNDHILRNAKSAGDLTRRRPPLRPFPRASFELWETGGGSQRPGFAVPIAYREIKSSGYAVAPEAKEVNREGLPPRPDVAAREHTARLRSRASQFSRLQQEAQRRALHESRYVLPRPTSTWMASMARTTSSASLMQLPSSRSSSALLQPLQAAPRQPDAAYAEHGPLDQVQHEGGEEEAGDSPRRARAGGGASSAVRSGVPTQRPPYFGHVYFGQRQIGGPFF